MLQTLAGALEASLIFFVRRLDLIHNIVLILDTVEGIKQFLQKADYVETFQSAICPQLFLLV